MTTKVLLIGPKCFNYNQSIASAFDANVFQIKVIDYAEQYGQINLINKILYFVSRNRISTTAYLLAKLNRSIIKVYDRYRPDIVIVIKGDTINEETVQSMKRSKNILWMMDGIFYIPQSIKLVPLMDAVFLFEKTDVEKLSVYNNKSFYLPAAYDNLIFKKIHSKKKIDLLFIGTLHDTRIKLLEKIQDKFPELTIKVFCERFRFYKTPVRYLKSLKEKVFINRFVTPKEANKLYNSAKVCLNMHHEQSVYGINPRFFEILGARALQFVDHKPFIDDYFSDYKVRTYKTEEELFEMIHQQFRIMKQPNNNMMEMDQKLFDTVRKHHTYKNSIEFILDKI